MSYFITGLKDNVWTDMKANRSTMLTMTIGLEKLYEACDSSLRKPINQENRLMNSQRVAPNVMEHNSISAPIIKRMTKDELVEWRRKYYVFIAMKGISLVIIMQSSFRSKSMTTCSNKTISTYLSMNTLGFSTTSYIHISFSLERSFYNRSMKIAFGRLGTCPSDK